MRRFLLFALGVSLIPSTLQAGPKVPDIVTQDKDGKLVYDQDARGNRIPDFSFAGYGGGGVALPNAPARIYVAPAAGDDGARIQAALNAVAQRPLDSSGIRGAVVLGHGKFEVAGSLKITASGVVLRGQGDGENGSIIVATGNSRRTLIDIRGQNDRKNVGPVRQVAGDYVPVNARTLELDDASNFKVGDSVLVERPSPQNWLDKMGMVSVPARPAPTWKADTQNITWDRRIESIDGKHITLDAPLTCALEREFGGGKVVSYEWQGRIKNVGVENLRCESTWDAKNPQDEEHSWMAVTLENVEDGWVRNVTAAHFVSSAVSLWETTNRITVQDCASLTPVSEIAGYRRHAFYTMGGQTLFLRCFSEEARHDFTVGWVAPGPNAFVRCKSRESLGFSGALESWATGILMDNVVIDGNELKLDNRELWDNGVGWAGANSVIYQCTAPIITARTPPTAQNWVIGPWAQFVGDATWRSPNEFVKPDSLYEAQLTERVGTGATKVLTKTPIASAVGNAQTIEAILHQEPNLLAPKAHGPLQKLEFRDGKMLVNGQLLIGTQRETAWWRGNVHPSWTDEFGDSITRFVPGRSGAGLTDDLDALTTQMAEKNQAVMRHHYGLWYERRRDDHEMLRRANADVWPPFFELPFARTGKGRAWNGLSLYDLTKYNTWYFGRLNQFASLSEQKGRVLVNAMYFQHNIIESGAHFVDFPWRTANNVNGSQMPEPPPFTGDTIHVANEFYDITNPVRRKLHQAYIQHNLDALADQPNVIHILSEEYTGPLHFMQFWLDEVAAWKARTKKQVWIGLSAPKDVQDAILADPKRAALVNVIDFRYWWQTDSGLFAPPGGRSMSPRQEERKWRGGRPNDFNLAEMAAEYRTRFPQKAVFTDFSSAQWAFVSAGGSVPNLPASTDKRLLNSLARLQPWAAATTKNQWASREVGHTILLTTRNKDAVKLDLRGESGVWTVYEVEGNSGRLKATDLRLQGNQEVELPAYDKGGKTYWISRNEP